MAVHIFPYTLSGQKARIFSWHCCLSWSKFYLILCHNKFINSIQDCLASHRGLCYFFLSASCLNTVYLSQLYDQFQISTFLTCSSLCIIWIQLRPLLSSSHSSLPLTSLVLSFLLLIPLLLSSSHFSLLLTALFLFSHSSFLLYSSSSLSAFFLLFVFLSSFFTCLLLVFLHLLLFSHLFNFFFTFFTLSSGFVFFAFLKS